jgi:hypothetical protein
MAMQADRWRVASSPRLGRRSGPSLRQLRPRSGPGPWPEWPRTLVGDAARFTEVIIGNAAVPVVLHLPRGVWRRRRPLSPSVT